MRRHLLAGWVLLVGTAAALAAGPPALGPGVPDFTVRPGYRVTVAADHLEEARCMALDDRGTLYVSQIGHGQVVALSDLNAQDEYQKEQVYLRHQKFVHGLCWHDGWLWFAPSTAIGRARGHKPDGSAAEVQMILTGLPGNSGHLWRSLLVTDQGFYTSVGDPGNITDQSHTDREKIWFYHLDGTGKTLFASGIRNTEKLRLRPGTQEVWGCDQGSDNFGQRYGEEAGREQPITDDLPPDEFNHYVAGGFYGHPFLVGNRIPRPEYQDRKDLVELATKTIVPAWSLGAHWAPDAFCFVSLTNRKFPPDHRGDAFIACHGSWNSSVKVGYRIQRILFDNVTGKPYGSLCIVSTLGPQGQVLGRPVDCVEAPDGTILFSVDAPRPRIYRISWIGTGSGAR